MKCEQVTRCCVHTTVRTHGLGSVESAPRNTVDRSHSTTECLTPSMSPSPMRAADRTSRGGVENNITNCTMRASVPPNSQFPTPTQGAIPLCADRAPFVFTTSDRKAAAILCCRAASLGDVVLTFAGRCPSLVPSSLQDTCFIGEVGLWGELKPVQDLEARVKARIYTPYTLYMSRRETSIIPTEHTVSRR